MTIFFEASTAIGNKHVMTHGTRSAAEMAAFLERFVAKDGLSDPDGYNWHILVNGNGLHGAYECVAAIATVESAKKCD